MTDARLPDQWLGDPRFDCWQPETWQFFTHCLMWSNRHLTDGHIPMKHARYLAQDFDLDLLVGQLESGGMCTKTNQAICLDWSAQSSRHEIEARKTANKVKQQNYRDRQKAEVTELKSQRSSDITGDITGLVGQDRLGQDDTF